MLSNGRVHSSDVEGAVSALLANQHSAARELLDGPTNPLRVTVTFDVILQHPEDASTAASFQEEDTEYVCVLMHAFEAGEWTAPRANIFSSAFESRANSSTKGDSPSRVDSNNSSAMPVVSLRGGSPPSPCMCVLLLCSALIRLLCQNAAHTYHRLHSYSFKVFRSSTRTNGCMHACHDLV